MNSAMAKMTIVMVVDERPDLVVLSLIVALGVCAAECESDEVALRDRCGVDGVCVPELIDMVPCEVDRDCLAIHPG